MSEEVVLQARLRARTGTSPVRRLRKEGDVPAILYGAGEENLSIAVNHDLLFHNLEREEFFSQVITINTAGKKERAILRAVQRHPHKARILHADFQRVEEDKPIHIALPIHFTGEEECVGVRIDGGMVSHLMNEVEVTCLPKDLPENIEMDVRSLRVGESLHLSDIRLPEGVQITAFTHGDIHEHDNAVVAVQTTRLTKSEGSDVTTDDTATDMEAED